MYPLERKEGGGVPRDDSGTLPESSRPAIPSPPVPAERVAKRKSYPSSKSRSTNREADRPGYVRMFPMPEAQGDDPAWLDFGLEERARFEIRDDFYRSGQLSDERFMMRTRAYLGIREIIDPLRFGFEFQDSRRFGSVLGENTGDVNEAEILQAFGELYFPDALGQGQPLSLRGGRMSFDAIDRRLFARNRFRNTTNAFDGVRLRLGDETSDWELDTFAFQPVQRRLRQFDPPDEERWIYGINGYWRGWSPHITLEPYYFILDEDLTSPESIDRELHTLGLHAFGLIGTSGFDYDFNFAYQLGNREDGDHRAFATHAELGYTFSHEWKPRVALLFDFATGDENPNDETDEQFDPLFGAAHTFYGYSDLFGWENTINPAFLLSLQPAKKLKIESYYRGYWLAADRDAFVRAGIVDSSGRSGNFVGQEFNIRFSYQIDSHTELECGYAHFFPGSFTRNATATSDDSDFFYVQVTAQF